jgi:phosphatidylglycerol lysyltransferase
VKDGLREPENGGAVSASVIRQVLILIAVSLPLSNPSIFSQRNRARELVLRFGWNATAYQILNPGIELWFSDAGDAVVGFVRSGGMVVVGGAPVCAPSRLSAVAAEFLAEAHSRGEKVCYFGAGGRLDDRYQADAEWSRVLLGAQPVWDPNHWPEALAKRRSLRAQLNRARNKGVTVSEWPAKQAENDARLRRVLAQWLETRHLPPLHFMVEPETLSHLDDRRVFAAEREGRVVAFTVLSPVPERNGWLFEQIVRGNSASNGTAELLLDTAMRAIAASGSTYATLGLSPLSQRAGLPQPRQPWWLGLVLRLVRRGGRRFYNFGGLDAFKAKFNPETWEPIYAIAEGTRFPPRALYAIAGAFSGGAPIELVFSAVVRAIRNELVSLARKAVLGMTPRRRSKRGVTNAEPEPRA